MPKENLKACMMQLDVRTFAEKFRGEEDEITLRRLLRKMEITGKLYSAYSSDLSNNEQNATIGTDTIDLLMMHTLDLAEDRNDARLLNSVLKITDGIMKTPRYIASKIVCDRAENLLTTMALR